MAETAGSDLDTALVQRWKDYRSQFKACRREPSEMAVHDLRVAARRLLGALDIIRSLKPRPRVRKVRGRVKNVLDALDDLRDVQVMLLELSKRPESIAEPTTFEAQLKRREKRLLSKAHRQLEASRPSGIRKRIRKIRRMLTKGSGSQESAALQAMDRLFHNAMEAAAQVSEPDPVSIHQARIAFKKFRYAAEIVQPFLPRYPSDQFSRMHAYQGRLGDIRDMDILVAALQEFNRKLPSPAAAAPTFEGEALRAAYQERRAGLMASYREAQGQLGTFWRAAPDQPFPWEMNNDALHHPSRDRRSARSSGSPRRRQPAAADQPGPQQDVPDRQGTEGTGGVARPDRDKPIPAGDPNSPHPGEEA